VENEAFDAPLSGVKLHPFLDAHQITWGLWQGARPPVGTAVSRAEFDLLILCEEDFQPTSEMFPGVELVYAPNDDDWRYPLTESQLSIAKKAAQRAAEAIKASKSVLVACYAGLNRSGLVVALALHQLYGWPGTRCIEHVRARRKWGVDNGMKALENKSFEAALKKLPLRSPSIQPPDPWETTPGGVYIRKT
jgi:protein-tyrosine phosphatase